MTLDGQNLKWRLKKERSLRCQDDLGWSKSQMKTEERKKSQLSRWPWLVKISNEDWRRKEVLADPKNSWRCLYPSKWHCWKIEFEQQGRHSQPVNCHEEAYEIKFAGYLWWRSSKTETYWRVRFRTNCRCWIWRLTIAYQCQLLYKWRSVWNSHEKSQSGRVMVVQQWSQALTYLSSRSISG